MGVLHRVLGRYAAHKLAAQVGTDSASIYAIAPEMLWWVIEEGEWKRVVDEEGWEQWDKLKNIIREHGGAAFSTGADGYWNVELDSEVWGRDRVKGEGAKKPYGSKDYIKTLKQKVKKQKDKEKKSFRLACRFLREQR